MIVLINGLQAGNRSGTGRYTTELVRCLPGLCPDIDVRVLWPRDVPQPSLSSGNYEAFQVVDVRRSLRRLYVDQVGLRKARKRYSADVVHYPANIGPLIPMRNIVLTVHDASYLIHPEWFRRDRALYYGHAVRHSARHAKRIIADSHAAAADLHAILRIPMDRIDVIPLGVGEEFRPVDEERQAAVKSWYKLPESFFLYVGTVEPRKNLVRLIEGWSRIAGECPHDLVIAGRDGWKVKPVRAAAVSSPHAARIHFPGFIAHDDLPAVLSAARVFAWPSLYEGFGLPPLEAMACGTPVVTSNASSLPEVVGDAALQVHPERVEDLAAAMFQAAVDDTLRASLKTKGLTRAATFTWDRTAKLTCDTYRLSGDKGLQPLV